MFSFMLRKNDINNSILQGQHVMPIKDSTSDGTSDFAMGRTRFFNTYNHTTTQLQQNHKKWMGNRDSSNTTANRRVSAIGASLNPTGGPLSFTSKNDNSVRQAVQRTRNSGYIVPTKVSQKYMNTSAF